MSKRRSKPTRPRIKVGEQFIVHPVAMLQSTGWRRLSLTERRILDRLEIELASHAGLTNGNLVCTYADLVKHGARENSIPKAIRNLDRAGLVEVVRHGRPAYGDLRIPSIYRLTYLPTIVDGEAVKPTHEWRQKATPQNAGGATPRNDGGEAKKPPRETQVNHGKATPRNGGTYLDLRVDGRGLAGRLKVDPQEPLTSAWGEATASPPTSQPSGSKQPQQAPAMFEGSSPEEGAALIRAADLELTAASSRVVLQ